MIHSNPLFRCYFGDAKDCLYPQEYSALAGGPNILSVAPFKGLGKRLQLRNLVFLRQMHTTQGAVIADQDTALSMPPFDVEGDYLITNQKKVGIGVMTADCLPIIIVDTVHGVIGIAHAGWRGTVAGIGTVMLKAMRHSFGTDPAQVKIFFGPCAQVCCYEVSDSFASQLECFPFNEQLIFERSGRYYFDSVLCNRLQLEEAGVPREALCNEYTICTIENSAFCSHRRNDVGRQMTVVTLL